MKKLTSGFTGSLMMILAIGSTITGCDSKGEKNDTSSGIVIRVDRKRFNPIVSTSWNPPEKTRIADFPDGSSSVFSNTYEKGKTYVITQSLKDAVNNFPDLVRDILDEALGYYGIKRPFDVYGMNDNMDVTMNENGGVFRSLVNVNDNIWKVDKVLWEQSEVLIGTLFLIELTGDPWAYHWFEKMYSYVMDKYPLKKYGYSLWNIDGDRKMTFVKQGKRIENYHHPRHLMLNILSLKRIIKEEGKNVSF